MGKPCLEKPLGNIIAPLCKKSLAGMEFTQGFRVDNIFF
jgi:hypothetical protein